MSAASAAIAIILGLVALAALAGLYLAWRGLRRYAGMACAFAAKTVCSGLFVAGRPLASLRAEELGLDQPAALGLCRIRVDPHRQLVRASFPGIVARRAACRHGLGSALVMETSLQALRAQARPNNPPNNPPQDDWPSGAVNPQALEHAFDEADPARPQRSRAAVVLHRGELLAERYAAGFGADTPQLGWSLSKTALGLLIGAAVRQGYLALDDGRLLPEWRGDERSEITLRQLLQMRGGQAWAEDYGSSQSEVMQMLFATAHTARYAVARPLAHAPGSHWCYSSGGSNVLSRVLQQALGDERYADWPRRALFAPLQLASAVFEADADGLFTASSYMYASARDWARIGQFMLQDGVWRGERLLPEGWMDFCTSPAPGSGGEYGAHLWLQLGDWGPRGSPPLPADAFHAVGHEGQFISVLPGDELVVVRLGLTRHAGSWNQAAFIDRVRRDLR